MSPSRFTEEQIIGILRERKLGRRRLSVLARDQKTFRSDPALTGSIYTSIILAISCASMLIVPVESFEENYAIDAHILTLVYFWRRKP